MPNDQPDQAVRFKTGKLPRKWKTKTLRLARFLTRQLPDPPPEFCNSRKLGGWGMMMNDQLGCCTIAAKGHAEQTFFLSTDPADTTPISIPDSVIVDYYENWDGYNPSDPSTDQGGNMLDVETKWRQQGFGGFRAPDAFATVSPSDMNMIKIAIWLFGGIDVGILLSDQDVRDFMGGKRTWNDPSATPTEGHDIWCPDYNADGVTCVTWGELLDISWPFLLRRADESYAILDEDRLPPTGFDLPLLQEELQLVTS